MIENQRLSLERGEKTQTLLAKSDELLVTSYEYRATARKTKQTMCARKWKYICAVSLLIIIIIVVIYFLFIR